MTWQHQREMSPREFTRVTKALGLSRAATARYLGRGERTTYRYASGDAEIPPAEVLLLRALVEFNVAPLAPARKRK